MTDTSNVEPPINRQRSPEWLVRDAAGKETRVAGPDALRERAKRKQLLPHDYVYNPHLQKWMYARDLAEIDRVFRLRSLAPVLFLLALLIVCGGVAIFLGIMKVALPIFAAGAAVALFLFSFMHA